MCALVIRSGGRGSRAEVIGSMEEVRRSSQWHIKGNTDLGLLGNGDPGACLSNGQQQSGAAATLCPSVSSP